MLKEGDNVITTNNSQVYLNLPVIGWRIATFIAQPKIQTGKMIFTGTWRHLPNQSSYELIGVSWQCEKCGSVTEGEQCACL